MQYKTPPELRFGIYFTSMLMSKFVRISGGVSKGSIQKDKKENTGSAYII
jgi:hypothetical protein